MNKRITKKQRARLEEFVKDLKARKDIPSALLPKFLNVSIQTNDLIEHAVEVWRLQHRLDRWVLPTLPEDQREIICNSFRKVNRYLDKNNIEMIDHTNQKFNDGLNVDILAVEEDPNVSEPIVKETKEPTIIHMGHVVRKGKVIIMKKGNDFSEGNTK